MADEKLTLHPDGAATIEQVTGEHNGAPTGRRWDLRADQVAKHAPMFNDTDRAEVRLSRGDVDAMRDAAHESAKRRAKGEA